MRSFLLFFIFCFGFFGLYAQFTEGFEGAGTPAGWNVINGGGANTWGFTTPNAPPAHGGTQVARIIYNATAHNDFLITPIISVTSGVNTRVKFWGKNRGSSTIADAFNVKLSTTGNTDPADFSITLASNVIPPTTWTEYSYDLSSYIGQNIYFSVQAISTDKWELYIDDFTNDAPLSCANPTSLTSGTITSNSAILNWTENGAGTAWDIEIQPAPFTFTGTPTVTGVTKPYTYMGLLSSTQYQYRVRPSTPSCPTNWSVSSGTFTTLAPPPTCPTGLGAGTVTVASLPYDSGLGQTTCGNGNNTTSSNVTVCGSTNYYGAEDKTYIFTPTVSGVHTIILTTVGDYDAGLMLYNGCPFSGTGGTCVVHAQSTTGLTRTLSPSLTAGVTYYLVADNWTAPACMASYRLQIDPPVACPTPLSVSSNTITSSSANITWACSGCTGTFIVEYGPPGFTPGSGATAGVGGTVINPATSPTALSLLDANSVYNVYVRQNCGVDGFSSNSTVHIFTTSPAPPANDLCDDAEFLANVTSGTVSGTTIGSNNEEPDVECDGYESTNGDVWYKIITDNDNINGEELIITITPSAAQDYVIYLYSGTCAALVYEACADIGLDGDSETITFIVTDGFTGHGDSGSRNNVELFVRVKQWGTPNGTFTLAASGSVLPITISKISAHNMGKNNMITWTTASEVNNDVQMVERSKDGISGWEMVGKVNGTNSREIVTYEVYDNNPYNMSFYRVHSIDFDGKEQFSKIVSVQREGRSGVITSIQPNPTSNFVEIDLQPEFDGNVTYTVMDATGKLLKTAIFSASEGALNTHMLDMSDLQSGLYIVSIQGGGINQNAKIFKQ